VGTDEYLSGKASLRDLAINSGPGEVSAGQYGLQAYDAIIPYAEALIAATGADFRIGGDMAFYTPSHDFILLAVGVSRGEVDFSVAIKLRKTTHYISVGAQEKSYSRNQYTPYPLGPMP
jgi:antirestriction protein ArdC